MRLGLAVVYLVTPGNEPLLDLHLDYIERTTVAPYAIFAAAARLEPGLRSRLAARPNVTLVDLPVTERRGPAENAYYLERLIAAALADGVTHVATLHVDSFPIRRGWDEEVAARLDASRPFAAVMRDEATDRKPCTALILSGAGFIKRYRPPLLLLRSELASREFRRYARCFPVVPDSGVGWGFTAWREGLAWYALTRSNRGEDHCHFGSVYDDLVFHLGAAAWQRKDFPGSQRLRPAWRAQQLLAAAARRALPEGPARLVRRLAGRVAPPLVSEPRYDANERAFREVRERLFTDPEGYLSFLRHGRS